MERDFEPRAAIRDLWLAELSEALDRSQVLLARLLVAKQIGEADADLLRTQIERLKSEVHGLAQRSTVQSLRPPGSDGKPTRS